MRSLIRDIPDDVINDIKEILAREMTYRRLTTPKDFVFENVVNNIKITYQANDEISAWMQHLNDLYDVGSLKDKEDLDRALAIWVLVRDDELD